MNKEVIKIYVILLFSSFLSVTHNEHGLLYLKDERRQRNGKKNKIILLYLISKAQGLNGQVCIRCFRFFLFIS